MTRERTKARLKELEEFYSWQQPPSSTVSIFFVDRDGSRQGCDIAHGPRDFVCRRLPDESLEAFHARAEAEVLARSFNAPSIPIGLVFSQEQGYA
jgi:hypothetical protein